MLLGSPNMQQGQQDDTADGLTTTPTSTAATTSIGDEL